MSWTWMHNQFGFHIQILIQKQLSFFEFIVKELKKNEKKKRKVFPCFKSFKRKMIKVVIVGS